jgi:glycosyltransferase involved in cell wall biosynthesis
MDRGEHLKQSLPTWLAVPQLDEIIIVDWDSKEDSAEEIAAPLNDGRIHILKVHDQELFNRGRCVNTGIHYAQGEYIFHVDADVCFLKNPLLDVVLDKYILYRATDRNTSMCGTCLYWREWWYKVGGYAEFLQGWGHDDDYFNGKLYPLGVKMAFMDFSAFRHIDHPEEMCSRYHKNKGRWASRVLNVAVSNLIRNVSFETELVTIIRPDGEKRNMDFPIQIIHKKEPIKEMEKIYKEQRVPQKHIHLIVEDEAKRKRENDGVPSFLEKSSHLPILQFPRPGRL